MVIQIKGSTIFRTTQILNITTMKKNHRGIYRTTPKGSFSAKRFSNKHNFRTYRKKLITH